MSSDSGQGVVPVSPADGRKASAAPNSCGCGGACGGSCPTCSSASQIPTDAIAPSLVYALGRIRPHIPNLGLEKEITHTAGRTFVNGPSDEEALIALLKSEKHRRLAQEVCWTFSVEGIDAYVLKPMDSFGLSLILETLRPDKSPTDVDVVIGRMIGKAGLAECNGKMLPVVVPSQLYSFDRKGILSALKPTKAIAPEAMQSAVKQTLDITAQLSGNFGTSPSQRALNYAVTRDGNVYNEVATQLLDNWALSGITTRPSMMGNSRHIVDVILVFRSRMTDAIKKSFLRVDVADLYPFLVTPIQPFIEFM